MVNKGALVAAAHHTVILDEDTLTPMLSADVAGGGLRVELFTPAGCRLGVTRPTSTPP
ncbi:MAG: hypothetical protein M3358_09000 [Actinomycetota bacterium]|nr:hypothetical protein [Actinomycetota bacterium]